MPIVSGGSGSGGGSGGQISQTIVTGSPAASISFSGIVGTYSSLQVLGMVRSSAVATNDTLLMRLNADSGANYSSIIAQVQGGGGWLPDAELSLTSMICGYPSAASSPANAATSVRIDIPGYAATTFRRSLVAQVGPLVKADSANNMFGYSVSGEWRSAAAVTAIAFTLTSGSFAVGSTLTLYGIV